MVGKKADTGYRGKCPERYAREEAIQSQFAAQLRDLVIAPEVLTWLQSELLESDRTDQAARAQEIRRPRGQVKRLQARLSVRYEDRFDGRIDAGMYDAKAEQVRNSFNRFKTASESPRCRRSRRPPRP